MPPKRRARNVVATAGPCESSSSDDHMFDDSEDTDESLAASEIASPITSMAESLTQKDMKLPRPPAIGPVESNESEHESVPGDFLQITRVASAESDMTEALEGAASAHTDAQITHVASAHTDALQDVRIDVGAEKCPSPHTIGTLISQSTCAEMGNMEIPAPMRGYSSPVLLVQPTSRPGASVSFEEEFSSTLSKRLRFVGGTLQHPLVRLTGQCTKIFSGTGGKESARSSLTNSPIASVAQRRSVTQRRSALGNLKSIQAMLRTPSLTSRIGSEEADVRIGKRFRVPLTQFSARGSRNQCPDVSEPSPVRTPRGSKIRAIFLGGGDTRKPSGWSSDRRTLSDRKGKMSPLHSGGDHGDAEASLPVDTNRRSPLGSHRRIPHGHSLSERSLDASRTGEKESAMADSASREVANFVKDISARLRKAPSVPPATRGAASSPSPTHGSPRPGNSPNPMHRFSASRSKLFNFGSSSQNLKMSSPTSPAPTPTGGGKPHFWPMGLFGRGESAEGELGDLDDLQTSDSVRRPPWGSKNRRADDSGRWHAERSFTNGTQAPVGGVPKRGMNFLSRTASIGGGLGQHAGNQGGSGNVARTTRTESPSDGDVLRTASDELGEEAKEDGTAEMAMRARANMAFYIRMAYLLALFIPDIVTFVVFQVAWDGPVFLCHTLSVQTPGMKLQLWRGEVDRANLGVLSAVLALHAWFLVTEVRAKGQEGRSGFRAFLSLKRQRGWSNVVWNAIYLVVVVASIVMLAVDTAECVRNDGDHGKAARMHRAHMLVHLLRCVCILMLLSRLSGTLRTRLQSMVSMNKRRFAAKDQKLDLDLTYICDRLIAMALPCVRDVLYRNDMQQVSRFFASRHYGHFVVTNLCNAFEEGGNGNYDPALLYNQVQRLPMHDHNAPFMQTLVAFLEGAVDFLNHSKANVVAVHCRGGKGRTGTFCAALMLWVGSCHSAEEAMQLFANRRTRPSSHACAKQGVDAPSQKRCLKYLERMIYEGVDILASSPLLLTKITLSGMAQGWRNLCVMVEEKGVIVYDSGKAFGALQSSGGHSGGFDLEICIDPILLHKDVTVRVFLVSDESRMIGVNGHVSMGGSRVQYQPENESTPVKGRQLAFVSFHTAFHDGDIVFTKTEVDGAYQDSECRFFNPDFNVTLSAFSGAFQDALGLIRITNPKSTLCFEVSGRLPPALDAMRMEQELDELMQRLSPKEEQVLQGQVVFDSRSFEAGQLCYIVSGQVSYTPVVPRADRIYGRLGISNCPVMGTVGSGSLLGMVEFLLGRGGSPFGTVYAAKTETVTVRRFTLPSSEHGPMIPCLAPEVSPTDLDTIFKVTAQALSYWSASLANQVGYVTEMNNVKHEYTVGMEMSEQAKLVKQIMEKYQIPVTERVLVLCDACMEKQEIVDGCVAPGIQGTLLVFQRWLVFVPPSGQANHEMLSAVKAISHTKLDKDKLVISFASPSQADSRDQPASQKAEGPASLRRSLLARSLSRTNVNVLSAIGKASPRLSFSPFGSSPGNLNLNSTPRLGSEGSSVSGLLTAHSSHTPGPSQQPDDSTTMARAWTGITGSSPMTRPNQSRKQSVRSVHETSIAIDSDRTFVFTEGMETAMKVQEAIEKQRQLHSEELAPPPLLPGGPSEIADVAHMFSLLLPDEELSGEDMQALQQLLSPFRRKRYVAGSQIFAEGDLNQVIFFVLAGTVSIRAGNAVLVTMQVGELVGERSFWGQGNRGKSAKMIAETDVEVQWLEFESIEIVCSGRPLVAARVARCLSMCIARRIQSQLNQLQQLETAISCTQDAL